MNDQGPPEGQLTDREFTVMFVDTVDSTEVKVRYAPHIQSVSKRLIDLFHIIRQETVLNVGKRPARSWRFNGDGAMVLYDGGKAGAKAALDAARGIHRKLEAENFRYYEPKLQLHIRIGIATGRCIAIDMMERIEPIGAPADLASRLCAEADVDGILIDERTRQLAGLKDGESCEILTRRLALKGIGDAPDVHRKFFTIDTGRMARPVESRLFENGLVKLYSDRRSLASEMSPQMILDYAAQGTEVIVSGRTLATWARPENLERLREAIRLKSLIVKFIILQQNIKPYLPDEEMPAHYADLEQASTAFEATATLLRQHTDSRGSLEIRKTSTVIFDGTTCFTSSLLGEAQFSPRRLFVLQDINASSFESKACLLIACSCSPGAPEGNCIAEGLRDRMQRVFVRAQEWA